MGKGDKKSRRGKIIIGSSGVRRPKSSKNTFIKTDKTVVDSVEKVKKVADKLKTEPKPKAKVEETPVITDAEKIEKPVKKAVKKAKAQDVPE